MSRADLRRRLPVPLRQHWKPLTAGLAGVAVALTVLGDVTIRPYSTSTAAVTDEERITEDVEGTVDLFDTTVDHELVLSYSQDDYDRMLDAYFTEGEKEWMTADITIDGTTIESAAIRLKGNSTLSSLVDDREGSATQGERAPGGLGGMSGGQMPGGGGEMPQVPGGGGEMPQMPGGGGGRGPGGGFAGTGLALSTQEPENLPLLVSFDENRPGRAYQGMTELAIRPASAAAESSLNEAVALELTKRSGQPTQDYAYTTYAVNDRPATTRLVVQNPDPQYAAALEGDGVLYKVESTSSFTYQGDDQTAYADDFTQVNLRGSHDLQPIVSFLEWLDGASDEEFAQELDQWVDVGSFATYLATQDVLGNMDTISGPGRNAYLYHDLGTGLISVVSWDLNLALGGMSLPGTGGGPGDGDGSARPGAPGGAALPALPEGVELPEGARPGAPGGGRGPEAMGGNALVTRFEASADLSALVDAAIAELRAEWLDSGQAGRVVEEVASRVPATDAVDQATIDADAQAVMSRLAGDDAP
ncbi:CotH kinase family protein [Cellulomonas sp. zg-ZUI199]|uniref:CotH kinase family protein n=1 Tax=Cellulomonas wangleii TaxID=2816956 RepID=A0ABX8D6E2_9CELL|nr:CotH kinase family protein [Cellulomonas wangleii]MBO0923709.1 CotH kinase family protein [Cellulomonas wangleii]MBO0923991.1 CotH kinase family protein [Cellulomonas wangleii]QVI62021.1 CotH kinase family protein [Cellulomonas wangleii]